MKRLSSIAWLTVISLAIGLIFLWISVLSFFAGRHVASGAAFQYPVLIELTKDSNESDLEAVKEQLKNEERIANNTILPYNEEEAFADMLNEFGSVDSLLDFNPFSKIVSFKWVNPSLDVGIKEKVVDGLLSDTLVAAVYVEEPNISGIKANMSKVSKIGMLGILLIATFSVLLLYNVMRLYLIRDEKKVKTMVLVGAKEKFIMRPYMVSALIIGLISFMLSALMVFVLLGSISYSFLNAGSFLVGKDIMISGVFVLITALLLPTISTYIIIRLYLRKL